MSTLVTGANGFIGSVLVRHLIDTGHSVRALVHHRLNTPSPWLEGAALVRGDITDRTSMMRAMKGCSVVYHLAGKVQLLSRDRTELYHSHVGGTRVVMETALKLGIQRVVHVSTCGIWEGCANMALTEADPPMMDPPSDYDLAKFLAEEVVQELHAKGLHAVIVNLTRVFGPGPLRVANSTGAMLRKILRGRVIALPRDLGLRANHAFVNDVVRGMILAMQHGRVGERYILGGENLSYHQFIATVEQAADRTVRVLRIPPVAYPLLALAEGVGSWFAGRDPRFNSALLRRLSNDRLFDNDKAMRELGYRITPFAEAVRTTLLHEQRQRP